MTSILTLCTRKETTLRVPILIQNRCTAVQENNKTPSIYIQCFVISDFHLYHKIIDDDKRRLTHIIHLNFFFLFKLEQKISYKLQL